MNPAPEIAPIKPATVESPPATVEDPVLHVIGLLNRYWVRGTTEFVAVKRSNGKPCPAAFKNPEFRDVLLFAHITRGMAADVQFFTKGKPEGWKERVNAPLVGVYVPLRDDSCPWGCFDCDGAGDGHKRGLADAKAAASALLAAAESLGVPLVLESSKSARGFHLWVFFEPNAQRADVRTMLLRVIDVAMNANRDAFRLADPTPTQRQEADFDATKLYADARANLAVEVFPKLQKPDPNSYGNCVWLPFWSGSPDGGSKLLDPKSFEPISALKVTELPTMSAEAVESVLAKIRQERGQQAAETRRARAMVAERKIEPTAASEVIPDRAATTGGSDVLERVRLWLQKRPPAVEGAQGDVHTFRTACNLVRGFNLTGAEALAVLTEPGGWNERCQPPWSTADLQKKIESARKNGNMPFGHLLQRPAPKSSGNDEKEDKRTQAEVLVDLAELSGAELWHTADGEPFATLPVLGTSGERDEHHALKSKAVKHWLVRMYWQTEQRVPNSESIAAARNVLDAKAIFDGSQYDAPLRLHGGPTELWLDLGDADWSAVRITPNGWTLEKSPKPRFRRSRGMLALPPPEHGGTLEDLRPFVNVVDADWPLLLAWLIGALAPRGPYPTLVLNGEQGSAKSTTTRVVRSLIDPNTVPIRCEPRDVRDLMIQAKGTWIVALDNISSVAQWLSDTLCRLATGGGYSTRELYANDEESLFDAQRPVILNGITDFVNRPDLLDRAVRVSLPAIPESRRMDEATFWSQFEQARPRILGALFDAVAVGLRRLPTVVLPAKPRLADFAKWVVAAEPALPIAAGAFMARYHENRAAAHELALEGSTIGTVLCEWIREKLNWIGSATELFQILSERAPQAIRSSRDWPTKPQVLSGHLKRLAPNLRAVGIDFQTDKDTQGRRGRWMSFSVAMGKTASQASLPSPAAPEAPPAATAEISKASNLASQALAQGTGSDAARHSPTASVAVGVARRPAEMADRDTCDGSDAVIPSIAEHIATDREVLDL